MQPAGPTFAENNSHKYGPAGPRNTDEKVMLGVQCEIFGSHPPTSRKWEKEELQFALGGFPRCSTATVISCSMPPMEALINGW